MKTACLVIALALMVTSAMSRRISFDEFADPALCTACYDRCIEDDQDDPKMVQTCNKECDYQCKKRRRTLADPALCTACYDRCIEDDQDDPKMVQTCNKECDYQCKKRRRTLEALLAKRGDESPPDEYSYYIDWEGCPGCFKTCVGSAVVCGEICACPNGYTGQK